MTLEKLLLKDFGIPDKYAEKVMQLYHDSEYKDLLTYLNKSLLFINDSGELMVGSDILSKYFNMIYTDGKTEKFCIFLSITDNAKLDKTLPRDIAVVKYLSDYIANDSNIFTEDEIRVMTEEGISYNDAVDLLSKFNSSIFPRLFSEKSTSLRFYIACKKFIASNKNKYYNEVLYYNAESEEKIYTQEYVDELFKRIPMQVKPNYSNYVPIACAEFVCDTLHVRE